MEALNKKSRSDAETTPTVPSPLLNRSLSTTQLSTSRKTPPPRTQTGTQTGFLSTRKRKLSTQASDKSPKLPRTAPSPVKINDVGGATNKTQVLPEDPLPLTHATPTATLDARSLFRGMKSQRTRVVSTQRSQAAGLRSPAAKTQEEGREEERKMMDLEHHNGEDESEVRFG